MDDGRSNFSRRLIQNAFPRLVWGPQKTSRKAIFQPKISLVVWCPAPATGQSRVRFPVCLLPRNQASSPRNQISAENMRIRKTFCCREKVSQNQPYGNPSSEKLKAILVYISAKMDSEKDVCEKTFSYIKMFGGGKFSENCIFSNLASGGSWGDIDQCILCVFFEI